MARDSRRQAPRPGVVLDVDRSPPPILFHHDALSGDAWFSDEAGRELDPKKIPQYILDDIADNPIHVVPQFAPPNLRAYQMDENTGQEFQPGQRIQQDILQGSALLTENRSVDLAAKENHDLLQQNKMLMERLAALEGAKKPAAKKARKAKARPKIKVAQA